MRSQLLSAGYRKLRKVPAKVSRIFKGEIDAYLRKVSGVIHIGANEGQERERYDKLGLEVAWVEPIPETFAKLTSNIASFPHQRAFQYLLTDKAGQEYEFNIASNQGASSSIFDLGLHKDLWPDVTYIGKIKVISSTLSKMVEQENLDITKYQALIMDTQGAELLILKGARDLLCNFDYIQTEAADFESYVGCCQLSDLIGFLGEIGFREVRRAEFAEREAGGNYFGVVFRRHNA